ncbi:MAG: HAMP domain-containing histidine kinase [Anaerolineales bacterium]|nr:HAMP domain-containing histidine kinase [Anaerolineales bacterium]
MSDLKASPQQLPSETLSKQYQVYLLIISLLGVCLAFLGFFQLSREQFASFVLLALLAAAVQSTATLTLKGVDFSVSSAVSLAAIPLFGPAPAAIVAIVAELALWVISVRADRPPWNKAIRRLGFNAGMSATSIFVAGLVFQAFGNLFGDSLLALGIRWLVTAVVADQANLWLLIIVLHLQLGVPPLEVWREHRWAVPLNVLVSAMGGAVLSLAVAQFNLLGVLIFFLPIAASAYSFRMYVRQAEAQMTKLEDLVELRTSDLARANDDLGNANSELAQLNKEMEQFLAVLTHDMRTPLTSIKGYASILRDRELEREQQTHIAKVILRSQDTLLEIVNNLLEIGKLQSGTPVLLERSSFDLALLVKGVTESLETQALEKNISLNDQSVPIPVEITGDEKKIQRIILNLISNAIKYTPDGGQVFIETQVNGQFAVVSVRDTGYGIPADELPFIFDRYSRVKKHQSIAIGTGLGLAIVKSLVEAHKGTISVESEEGVGSSFTISLPIQVIPSRRISPSSSDKTPLTS